MSAVILYFPLASDGAKQILIARLERAAAAYERRADTKPAGSAQQMFLRDSACQCRDYAVSILDGAGYALLRHFALNLCEWIEQAPEALAVTQ